MPGKVSGAWLVKNSRVPADAVLDNALDGFTAKETAAELFEGLTETRIQAVLDHAKAHEGRPA